jgi:hypothetical protein
MPRLLPQLLGALLASLALGRQAHAVEVALTVSPSEIVLGRTATARIVAEVTGAGAERVRGVRLECSVGTLSAPRRVGPSAWEVTYRLPTEPYPQLALLLARTEGAEVEAFGAAVVRLLGRTEIAFRTDPGATVTVDAGGATFGPTRAGTDGVARLAVVVGPGQSTVVATSVDVVGNRSDRDVTIALPDYGRAVLLGPRSVVAGQPATVAVMAVDAVGAPATLAELVADRGTLGEVRTAPGSPLLRLVELTPPALVGSGLVTLRARAPGETGEAAAIAVEVVPDHAEAVVLTLDRETLVPGSSQSVTLHAAVRDRYGNIHPDDQISLTVSGQPILATPSPEGGVAATLPAPPAEAGLGALVVEARSRDLVERRRIELNGGPAVLARIEAPTAAVADGRTARPIRVLLVGETGLPADEVPNIRARHGRLRDLTRDADGWWRVEWVPRRSAFSSVGVDVIEAARGPATARARIELTPPVPWFTVALSLGLRTNIGALVGPEGELELSSRVGLRRGWLVLGLRSGLFYERTTYQLAWGESELRFTDIPLGGGFGYGITLRGRVGINVMALGGVLFAVVEERTSFRPSTGRLWYTPLIEGTVDISIAFGPGELFARVGFGYAAAPEGSGLSGNLLGLLALIGYRIFVV